MRSFDYFVSKRDVKKVSKDISLARSLIETGKERLSYAKSQKLSEYTARFILEDAYEAVRETIDAKLILDGYKSYSHEASIAYLRRLKEFTEADIQTINHFRILRNRTKYYGKRFPLRMLRKL